MSSRFQLVFNSFHERVLRSVASQTQSTLVDVVRRMVDATAGDPVVLGRMFPLSSGQIDLVFPENDK